MQSKVQQLYLISGKFHSDVYYFISIKSDTIVVQVDDLECSVQAGNKVASVLDLDSELPLDGVVHLGAGGDVSVPALVVPVGFESYWHSFPTIRVNFPQSLADALGKSLSNHTWLLFGLLGEGLEVVVELGHSDERAKRPKGVGQHGFQLQHRSPLLISQLSMVLGRHPKKYWLTMRTMVTQLVEHERIKTTQAKAKHLHSFGEYIIRHAKKASSGHKPSKIILDRILRTKLAKEKAVLQLAERFKNTDNHFTKVSRRIYNRRGDNAPVVTIEYRGHSLPPYPPIPEGYVPTQVRDYKLSILNQRKQRMEARAAESQERKEFFQKKVKDLEFELMVENRKAKSGTLYTYYN